MADLSPSERLAARLEAARLLRVFDAQARAMRLRRMAGRAGSERKMLAEMLSRLGGEPWPYSASGDNSWLPRDA